MSFNIKLLRRFPDAEVLIQSEDLVPNCFIGLATLIAVGGIEFAIDQGYIAFEDDETEMDIVHIFPKSMDGSTDDEIGMKTINKLKIIIEAICGPDFLPALQREIEFYELSKLQ